MSLVDPMFHGVDGDPLGKLIEAMMKDTEDSRAKIHTLTKALTAANTRISQLEADLSVCESECADNEDTLCKLRATLQERTEELEAAEGKIEDLTEQLRFAYSN